MPKPPLPSDEVTLFELGQAVAGCLANVHDELSRQARRDGGHRLQEFELSIPVRMRIDDLNQPLVQTTDQPGATVLRFRFDATSEPPTRLPPTDQPLSALGVLGPKALAALRARRVNSVQDFARIAQTPGGRAGLLRLGLGVSITRLLDRADVLSLPLPAKVTQAMVRSGVESLRRLQSFPDAKLAAQLGRLLNSKVTPDQVAQWKRASNAAPPSSPVSVQAEFTKRQPS